MVRGQIQKTNQGHDFMVVGFTFTYDIQSIPVFQFYICTSNCQNICYFKIILIFFTWYSGSCLVGQGSCGTEVNCYDNTDRCDGIWDCPISGQDEKYCSKYDSLYGYL